MYVNINLQLLLCLLFLLLCLLFLQYIIIKRECYVHDYNIFRQDSLPDTSTLSESGGKYLELTNIGG